MSAGRVWEGCAVLMRVVHGGDASVAPFLLLRTWVRMWPWTARGETMPTLRVAGGVGQVLKDMVEWQNPPCNRPSPLSGIIDVFLVPVTFRKTSVACNQPRPSRYSSASRSVSP